VQTGRRAAAEAVTPIRASEQPHAREVKRSHATALKLLKLPAPAHSPPPLPFAHPVSSRTSTIKLNSPKHHIRRQTQHERARIGSRRPLQGGGFFPLTPVQLCCSRPHSNDQPCVKPMESALGSIGGHKRRRRTVPQCARAALLSQCAPLSAHPSLHLTTLADQQQQWLSSAHSKQHIAAAVATPLLVRSTPALPLSCAPHPAPPPPTAAPCVSSPLQLSQQTAPPHQQQQRRRR